MNNKKINICFVTSEYAHKEMGKTGGIGVFIKKHAQYLKNENFKVVVFTYGSTYKKFDDEGVEVVMVRDLRSLNIKILHFFNRIKLPGYYHIKLFLEYLNRFYLSMYLTIFSISKSNNIIEFNDYRGGLPFFIGKGVKIIRCHGSALILYKYMGYTKRAIDIIFEKLLFKRFTNDIVAVSSYSANITKESFNLQVIPKVIYNGVKYLNGEKESYFDTPTIDKSIFYFGLLTERKGLDTACKVFNEVIEQFPTATFHIVGRNANQNFERVSCDILTRNALENTIYHGFIQNDKIFDYLKKAHVVIFPSYGETFSLALIEVLSIGKLVVTSDIPAFKEIIKNEHNGFIVNSIKKNIEIISKIFNGHVDTELLSKNARMTIKEKFSLSIVIKKNVNYYKSLIKNRI